MSYDYEPEDDGTMPANVEALAEAVVGHRIVKVERNATRMVKRWYSDELYPETVALALTLDDGSVVTLQAGGDCCAYTDLEGLVEHLPTTDHIITSVTSSPDYERWHILADMGEVLELQVGWSAGNPFYYAYGFSIDVQRQEVAA